MSLFSELLSKALIESSSTVAGNFKSSQCSNEILHALVGPLASLEEPPTLGDVESFGIVHLELSDGFGILIVS